MFWTWFSCLVDLPPSLFRPCLSHIPLNHHWFLQVCIEAPLYCFSALSFDLLLSFVYGILVPSFSTSYSKKGYILLCALFGRIRGILYWVCHHYISVWLIPNWIWICRFPLLSAPWLRRCHWMKNLHPIRHMMLAIWGFAVSSCWNIGSSGSRSFLKSPMYWRNESTIFLFILYVFMRLVSFDVLPLNCITMLDCIYCGSLQFCSIISAIRQLVLWPMCPICTAYLATSILNLFAKIAGI